ncbi:hypothetical protein PENTCL1PPCAC_12492, partial [Pristionchus entomophagus]
PRIRTAHLPTVSEPSGGFPMGSGDGDRRAAVLLHGQSRSFTFCKFFDATVIGTAVVKMHVQNRFVSLLITLNNYSIC